MAKLNASIAYRELCRLVLFVIVAGAAFHGYYTKWHFAEAGVQGEDSPAAFEAMVDGTAYRPYVYRRLLPAVSNELDRIAPARVKDWWLMAQGQDDDAVLLALLPSTPAHHPVYAFRYLALYCQTFLWTLVAIYLASLVASTLGIHPLASAMAAVAFVLTMPLLETKGGFFYDFPEFALFCIAFLLARRGRWLLLAGIAALATFNKESFLLFLLTLYPILPASGRRRSLLLLPAVSISVSIFILVHVLYRHNPGAAMEFWPREHLRMLANIRKLSVATEETYGIRLLQSSTVLPIALMLWTVRRAWPALPQAYRKHAQVAAAINLPLYVLCCYPGEMRDLSLLFPILTLCIAWNIHSLAEASLSRNETYAASERSETQGLVLSGDRAA